ncbi:MAG: hypothetical protein ABSG73_00410 [Candidatus Aminicenantales bacterium]|jgi:hypothetical protein
MNRPEKKFKCLGYFWLVKRQYNRLKLTHDGVPFTPGPINFDSGDLELDFFAFFLFCYHLKDWIKKDPSVDKKTKTGVEDFINSTPCLLDCANLANGIKHLRLDKPPRGNRRPRFKSVHRKAHWTPESVVVVDSITMGTDEGEIEAFDLASKCLAAWQDYIDKHILGSA